MKMIFDIDTNDTRNKASTHTYKKKNDKIILLKGRKYVITVFIPIDINQYFADTHKEA